jgi:phosphoribosylanthranilate isomerase
MSVKVKICGLTREADVDAAAAAGADFIGFVLYARSPRGVRLARARELAARLPAAATPVLLLVNENATEFIASYRDGTPATVQKSSKTAFGSLQEPVLQFHGDESPETCREIANALGLAYWKAARIPAADPASFDIVKFMSDFADAQAILLDVLVDGFGGSGHRFDWDAFPWSRLSTKERSRLVLSGGLTTANVADGVRVAQPWAVDVSSGVEAVDASGSAIKGVKDAEKIKSFIAAARAA